MRPSSANRRSTRASCCFRTQPDRRSTPRARTRPCTRDASSDRETTCAPRLRSPPGNRREGRRPALWSAAGLWSPNASAYTAFTLGKSVMSVTNTRAFATWCKVRPQSSRIARMFAKVWRASASTPPSTTLPVAGSKPPCPDRITHSPACTAGEYGPSAGGACGVGNGSTVMCAPSGVAVARRVCRGPGRCRAACPRPGRAHSSTRPPWPRTPRRTARHGARSSPSTISIVTGGMSLARRMPNDRIVRSCTSPASTASPSRNTQPRAMCTAPVQ